MAHVYRHKTTKSLYKLEHLIKDIRHLNKGANEGIYATPINKAELPISHTRGQFVNKEIDYFDPDKFIEDNFEVVSEVY